VRTTFILDDELYRRVKMSAAERGVTVTSVVEEALRLLLAQQAAATPPSLGPMPVDANASWVRPGIDVNDGSAVLEALDADRGIDAVR